MLSILIPIYNFNVVDFVKDLQQQCENTNIAYEIVCVDDCSSPQYSAQNNGLKEISGVTYEQLDTNIGRSQIRNFMAQKANYDWLLFLDADSKTNDKQFIQRYVHQLTPDSILYGGRNYASSPPDGLEYNFRWWYGKNREVISVKSRQSKPYASFMTNNFLIPREIFLAIGLDESLKRYGHEDTLFGMELRKKEIPVIHIDNPLCHIGLEEYDVFMEKTKEGIQNLWYLIQQGKIDDSVRLFRYYKTIKKWQLDGVLCSLFKQYEHLLLKKLKGTRPNLKWFDCYKLGYLTCISRS